MEVVRISDKGQMILPLPVREKLHLKNGDKIAIVEENGQLYLKNAALLALDRVAKAFEGEAEKAGFHSIDDVTAYIKELRREAKSKNASHG